MLGVGTTIEALLTDIARHQLSSRGEALVANRPLPPFIDEHFARAEDAWDLVTNPDGYVSMCLAENKLVWDLLEPKMAASRDVPGRVIGYDAMVGALSFREALAQFLGDRLFGRSIEPEHVIALAGSGSVLETLFYAIANPGDGVLVPTPSYTGFWPDLETRDELQVVPVHTTSATSFQLTADVLDEALDAAAVPVKALLFTSPDNPQGRVYEADQINDILTWAERRQIHVVLDELYAFSVHGDREFVSGAALRPALGELIHLVWAFSKDFAVSGLRCGVLVSENAGVLGAVGGLAYWSAVSGDTQYLLEQLISDRGWVAGFVAENERRLREAYRRTVEALDTACIPYFPAQGGFFLLCDLRPFMDTVTWEAEAGLWTRLLEEANVNLTPGADCHIGEPGFMRLCFAGIPTDGVVAGIERLGRLLDGGGI